MTEGEETPNVSQKHPFNSSNNEKYTGVKEGSPPFKLVKGHSNKKVDYPSSRMIELNIASKSSSGNSSDDSSDEFAQFDAVPSRPTLIINPAVPTSDDSIDKIPQTEVVSSCPTPIINPEVPTTTAVATTSWTTVVASTEYVSKYQFYFSPDNARTSSTRKYVEDPWSSDECEENYLTPSKYKVSATDISEASTSRAHEHKEVSTTIHRKPPTVKRRKHYSRSDNLLKTIIKTEEKKFTKNNKTEDNGKKNHRMEKLVLKKTLCTSGVQYTSQFI